MISIKHLTFSNLNNVILATVLISAVGAVGSTPAAAFQDSNGNPVYHHSGMGGRGHRSADGLSQYGGYRSGNYGRGYGSEYGSNGYGPRDSGILGGVLGNQ